MRSSRWIPLLLLFGLTLPVFGQPSPDGTRAVSELQVDLRLEMVHRVVDAIALRLDKTSSTKAELVRSKRNASEAFGKRHLTSDVDTMLAELFKNELQSRRLTKADLKFDLMLHRSLKTAYRIRDISDRMPRDVTGFSPPRSSGYPAEVAAIDNRAPHSMHDLRDYMADRFTIAALDRIVQQGRTVEIHVGGEFEALSDLKNRGWTLLGEVTAPKGNYERLLMAEGPGGEIRYIVTGDISGMDRVRHLLSLLRFAGPQGRGVPNAKIEIVGDVDVLAENQLRSLRSGLSTIGLPGERAIIGFRGALKTELTERALARRGAEHARDVLGSNPFEGLVERLTAEHASASGAKKTALAQALEVVQNDAKVARGLRISPAKAFAEVASLKRLQAAEKVLVKLAESSGSTVLGELVADGKLRLPGGVSSKDHGVARRVEFGALRAEELRVKTSSGVESLKLLNNYYGDTMSSVVRALLETGHTKLAYFGTAGGIGEGVRVGDIHVPKDVYNFRGELTSGGVKNAFIEYFEGKSSPLGERLEVGTKLGNVFSPAEETMRWLEESRNKGLRSVEVENSYITEEVSRFNRGRSSGKASLHTSVIISDIPGGEHTLGNNNGATTSTFEKMVDHYLEAMGIKDLEIVEKTGAKRPTAPLARDDHRRNALEAADKLIPRARAKSSFMRDNLAGILQRLDPAALNTLNQNNSLKPADVSGLSEADKAKLEAEVKNAYTDAQLLESVERGNSVVSRVAEELARRHPNSNYELKVGGGIETGRYSPVDGLVLEVTGSEAVKNTARQAIEAARAEIQGAPEVRMASAGNKAISLGKGEVFRAEPRPLIRELHDRALTELGANHRGTRVEYSGRQHDPANSNAELNSRFEVEAVGPRAPNAMIEKFVERIGRYGGRVEYVSSTDPRLRGAQARTMLDAQGRTLVLLPNDKPVRSFALIDELTHVRQIDRMTRELGSSAVQELFNRAAQGDPAAIARMLEWEIQAKRMVRMTLAENDPNRRLLDREIERLRQIRDPYVAMRKPGGRINWERVRSFTRTHAEGSASFLLGLFLKDLARVIHSGDREVIEAFFDGLATTEFWQHYGLFVVGAEAGSMAYARFLQRFVKPGFVSSVLKSNVALATGMALPELVRGHFDGRTYAINLVGLMLSSTAVKAGLAAIKWVVPMGRLSRYRGLTRALSLARGVPGWIYAGVETAVVLYFGEEISSMLSNWLEERESRSNVANAAREVVAAARVADGAEDERLVEALEEAALAYTSWRDRSLQPAMAATARFQERMEKAGREATTFGRGASRFSEIANRYPHLTASVERVSARSDAEVDAMVDEAVRRFERDRDEGLRAAYEDGVRSERYDPLRDPRDVSENRPQAYDDEAALYEAAAAEASDPAVREILLEWARTTRVIKQRERELLRPSASASSPARGAASALEASTR